MNPSNNSLLDLAATFRRSGQWEHAAYYYGRALEIAAQTNDVATAAECTYCLGLAYQLQGDSDSARVLLERSLRLHIKLGNLERQRDIEQKLEKLELENILREFSSLDEFTSLAKPSLHKIDWPSLPASTNPLSSYRVLILGAGQQGGAVIWHMGHSPNIARITIVDIDLERARRAAEQSDEHQIECLQLDARDLPALRQVLSSGFDVIVDILPKGLRGAIAELAVDMGIPVINTYNDHGEIRRLHTQAQAKSTALIPGITRAPGLELLFCQFVISRLDIVTELYAFTGGFPEMAAVDNPLKYKFSWSPIDYLRTITFPARIWRQGLVFQITPREIYEPTNLRVFQVPGLGKLEAFLTGNMDEYIMQLDLASTVQKAARFGLAWPGHAAARKTLLELGLLEDQPIEIGNTLISPREFLHQLLSPRLRYKPWERDVTCIRVEGIGLRDQKPTRVRCELVDYADPATQFLSQSRVVGFSASIIAQMLVRGNIPGSGVLSTAKDIDPSLFVNELIRAGIQVNLYESN